MNPRRQPFMQWLIVVAMGGGLALGAASCTASIPETGRAAIGDPENGERLVEGYGCIACHAVEGTSNTVVGPPLDDVGRRGVIAGKLANTPENMVLWLMDPQDVDPGNAMPDLDVPREDAEDMAAYLYQL